MMLSNMWYPGASRFNYLQAKVGPMAGLWDTAHKARLGCQRAPHHLIFCRCYRAFVGHPWFSHFLSAPGSAFCFLFECFEAHGLFLLLDPSV
ncbi:hypothetical protein MANES_09G114750v8 [Manihot esculenta]|uniref:Uncharacterized protein n=1 Tax=Manihot esculenta TaxID=3983 RepID=A0ACB7HAB7_MANES|nr:hypothetical protein MANES_09G114750v8 [Manihot esculenta]